MMSPGGTSLPQSSPMQQSPRIDTPLSQVSEDLPFSPVGTPIQSPSSQQQQQQQQQMRVVQAGIRSNLVPNSTITQDQLMR